MRVEVSLRLALTLAMKAVAYPNHADANRWVSQSCAVREEAAMAFEPEMKRRLNISNLYAAALREVPDEINGVPARALPETCRVTLAQLLGFLVPLDLG
jgi:hypothetical protein